MQIAKMHIGPTLSLRRSIELKLDVYAAYHPGLKLFPMSKYYNKKIQSDGRSKMDIQYSIIYLLSNKPIKIGAATRFVLYTFCFYCDIITTKAVER